MLSSGTCCIYEVERISNGKRVSLGESSKSLSLYFLFPFLLYNPLRRNRIQKETGQRQVFPCSATEMRKTCTRISFSIHNSQESEFESAFGTNFNDNSRRGANRKRTSQCKDIEAGHNVKMPPCFSSAYPNPLATTTHYPLPLFLFILILLGFRCATFTTCARPFIHHKWHTRNFQLNFHFAFASKNIYFTCLLRAVIMLLITAPNRDLN